MPTPPISDHLKTREPSDIRIAGIKFAGRKDHTQAVNVAIGNVSLPMHPAMTKRMLSLQDSPFKDGVVKYTATVGTDEARAAFLHVLASSGCSTEGLHCQITDGGSQGMELVILATCGQVESAIKPLLLIDAAYTNYNAFAGRLRIPTTSVCRSLTSNGKFSLPPLAEVERLIRAERPGALVVIPYDNPTGHYYDHQTMVGLGRLCVEHNLWLISDEAYRELFYGGGRPSSVWALTEAEVPGITGRRMSLETTSKVWNPCGLRIGAIITDNAELHTRLVAENTASLCSNAIGQHIFGALAHVPHDELQVWYKQQRDYYSGMMRKLTVDLREALPGVIVSSPDAALYSVIDVRDVVAPGFDALEFSLYCAERGSVDVDGGHCTLLVAPMAGFYRCLPGQPDPGRTQMRVAYVEAPARMQLVPRLLAELLTQFESHRKTAVLA